MPGLLTAAIAFGTVLVAELPDNSGLASLVLVTRYRVQARAARAAHSQGRPRPHQAAQASPPNRLRAASSVPEP